MQSKNKYRDYLIDMIVDQDHYRQKLLKAACVAFGLVSAIFVMATFSENALEHPGTGVLNWTLLEQVALFSCITVFGAVVSVVTWKLLK